MAKGKLSVAAVDFCRRGVHVNVGLCGAEGGERGGCPVASMHILAPGPQISGQAFYWASHSTTALEGKKRNKKQTLHLASRLSFLAPGENEHKILPSPSGTNTEKIFLVESQSKPPAVKGLGFLRSRALSGCQCLSSSNTGRVVSPQKARWC